jgi:hypothetical protein
LESNWSLGLSYYGLNELWELGGDGIKPTLAAPFSHGFGRMEVLLNSLGPHLQANSGILPSMEDEAYIIGEAWFRAALHFPYGYAVTPPLPVLPAMRIRRPVGLFHF